MKYIDVTVPMEALAAGDATGISTHQYLINTHRVPESAIFINAVSMSSEFSNAMVELKYAATGYMSGNMEWIARIYPHGAIAQGNYDFRFFYV